MPFKQNTQKKKSVPNQSANKNFSSFTRVHLKLKLSLQSKNKENKKYLCK